MKKIRKLICHSFGEDSDKINIGVQTNKIIYSPVENSKKRNVGQDYTSIYIYLLLLRPTYCRYVYRLVTSFLYSLTSCKLIKKHDITFQFKEPYIFHTSLPITRTGHPNRLVSSVALSDHDQFRHTHYLANRRLHYRIYNVQSYLRVPNIKSLWLRLKINEIWTKAITIYLINYSARNSFQI